VRDDRIVIRDNCRQWRLHAPRIHPAQPHTVDNWAACGQERSFFQETAQAVAARAMVSVAMKAAPSVGVEIATAVFLNSLPYTRFGYSSAVRDCR
jgi:hypothetical protein